VSSDTWGDADNWRLGHWITGRLASAPLAAMVSAILSDYGFSTYDASRLTGMLAGFVIDRVLSEPKSSAKFYLDSGWPGDNYEVTLSMSMALVERGYQFGRDFLHIVFPNASHGESAWATRLHLPVQLFSGKVARASQRFGKAEPPPDAA
jgi:hypothetical protein